jgi:hypothetical protein
MTRARACDCERCFFCDCVLSSRHEHDHFPLPAPAGGKETVPICLNCHDLKDRIPFLDWPMELVSEWLEALRGNHAAKLLFAQMTADNFRRDALHRACRERLVELGEPLPRLKRNGDVEWPQADDLSEEEAA